MNLLPAKINSNEVSKCRHPRPQPILTIKEGWWLAEAGCSVKAQACSVPLCGPGAFPLSDGAWLSLNVLPHMVLGQSQVWLLPIRTWIPAWHIWTPCVEDRWTWAQHTQLCWKVRFGSCKSQREAYLFHSIKTCCSTVWGYFSISFPSKGW